MSYSQPWYNLSIATLEQQRPHFSHFLVYKMAKSVKNDSKITKIIPEFVWFWPFSVRFSVTSRLTFGLSVSVKNVLKYSTFDYWLSRYIFPKLLEIPKLLPECMALISTLWTTITCQQMPPCWCSVVIFVHTFDCAGSKFTKVLKENL